jgi:hypothetical protein
MLLLGVVAAWSWVLLAPAAAVAGTFSRLLPLPEAEMPLAVNDHGQVVGVMSMDTGVEVVRLRGRGVAGHPAPVALPKPYAGLRAASVVFDARDRVALGLVYDDGFRAAEGHSGTCCDRLAFASWRLGGPVPTVQVLSHTSSQDAVIANQPAGPPLLQISAAGITALWASGDPALYEPGITRINQAFGAFGGPLQTAGLMTTGAKVSNLSLSSTRTGLPLATWLVGETALYGSRTSRGRGLRAPARLFRVHGLGDELGVLASDTRGDRVFAFGPGYSSRKLFVVNGQPSGHFGWLRVLHIVHLATPPLLVAGGARSWLLVWQDESFDLHVARGTAFGRSVEETTLGEGYGLILRAFIDSRGRAVVVYERGRRRGELVAVTAQPGRPLGRPRRIAALPRDCSPPIAPAPLSMTLVNSPNGHAVLEVSCDKRSYWSRYTP